MNWRLTDHLDRIVRTLNRWAETRRPGWRRRLALGLNLPLRVVWHLWRNRRYLTAGKLLNIAVVNVEYLLRRERLLGLPYDIKIEPTNRCGGGCRLCPTGQGLQGRAKGVMPFERFERLVEQIRDHAYVLDLSNWGDPLASPEIYRMIRCAHDARIWTYLSSTLALFDPARDAEMLIRSGLDMLNVSLHAATPETCRHYQPGRWLQADLDKLRALLETRRRLGSRTPIVRLFFVVTRHNEHEIEPFRQLARELDCQAVFAPASLNLRFLGRDRNLADRKWPPERKRQVARELAETWLPRDPQWIAPWYRRSVEELIDFQPTGAGKPYRCDWPWRRTVINWDGGVAACCGVFDPRHDLGNVGERPLREIWNGPAYRAARRSFRRPVRTPVGESCEHCMGVLP